jgi:hypothetical protein
LGIAVRVIAVPISLNIPFSQQVIYKTEYPSPTVIPITGTNPSNTDTAIIAELQAVLPDLPFSEPYTQLLQLSVPFLPQDIETRLFLALLSLYQTFALYSHLPLLL